MAETIKILLVDDQQDFLETMSFWMNQKGYDVTTVLDSLKGVKLVQEQKFDIVFVDYKMPGLTGLDFIARVREFNKTLSIVMVTSYASDTIIHENQVKDLNISGFFSKMRGFDDLEKVLDIVLRGIRRSKGEKT